MIPTNRSPRRAFLAVFLMVVLGIAFSVPAFSFLPMLENPTHPDRWDFSPAGFPVNWSINSTIGANITGTRTVTDVIQASFDTWVAAPNAVLAVSKGPISALTSGAFDGTNLVCFVCTGDFAKEADTLAVTTNFAADALGEATKHGPTSTFVGQIVDSDILFNPNSQFSTSGGTAQDLQTVATHEIGHFFGLDHSGVVRAMMYPFAPPSMTSLSSDDVAGISSLYAKAAPDVPVGSISGTVSFTSGGGVFGAHVFADSETSSVHYGPTIRKTPISAVTDAAGAYTITGLPVDTYVITAEPLDQPVDNTNIAGYAPVFGKTTVQANFNTRWH